MLKKAMLALAIAVVIAALSAGAVTAVSYAPPQFGPPRSEQSQQQREIEEHMLKEANKKRQEEIREDTQKLFQLASELKEAVGKTNEHVLSLDVVKKAEEVEKLAKKVKEKMREGVGRPPEPQSTPSPRPPFGPP